MTLRQEYLAAMGLESWVLRTREARVTAAPPEAMGTDTATWATATPPEAVGTDTATWATAALPEAMGTDTATWAATAEPGEFQPGERNPVEPGLAERQPLEPELAAARAGAAGAPREAAYDWVQLRRRVAACTRCGLAATRTRTVFGVGSPRAQWLIVGEAPGVEEDRAGEPFVGRAGQLLNAMLRAIGLERDAVYIANVLKCRPPHNRDPLASETAECVPYLERQIALLQPKIMLGVGRIAAQNLLRTDVSLSRLRQKVHRFGESQLPLVVTYHPAYLLRTPSDKRKAWEDLKFALEVFARG